MGNNYARLSTRVKAAVIDSIVLITLMYSATEIFNAFETVSNTVRISVFIFLFLLYEPILVSIFGATIGHFFNDIVVKKEKDETKNINFPIAIVRFILKAALGWLSLLTIHGDKKGQAIHDSFAKSIVKPFKK
ncbi:RDD family protein [Thalassobellus sediminis]|uniref:RDD family protein n=1 Tax=Thalassobellus sediminis TaxID=3367753 RepID=UPI0037938E1B